MKKWTICLCALGLCLALYMANLICNPQTPQLKSQEVSLQIPMVKNEELSLSCQMLEERLQLEEGALVGITLTQLPDQSEGALYVGNTLASPYQNLTRQDIEQLSFVPTPDAVHPRFCFIPQSSGQVVATVSLSIVEESSPSPLAHSEHFITYASIPIYGDFPVSSPSGQELSIVVLTPPQKGTLKITGNSFVYIPYPNTSGEDAFTYCAQDTNGQRSQECSIALQIDTPSGAIAYADMKTHPSAYAAFKLNEAGIMGGQDIGGQTYFSPQRPVTNAEYLLLLLSSLQIQVPSTCLNTGLSNDTDIPLWLKPSVQAGIDAGIITESTFAPDATLTRAQAVVLARKAMDISPVKVHNLDFLDTSEIPDEALQAYMDLDAYGILTPFEQCIYPLKTLDRAGAADLIWQIYQYAQSQTA